MNAEQGTRLSRSDGIAMYVTAGMVAVPGIITWVAAIQRLMEVAPGRDIPVTVPLMDETASLPLGPDGTAVTAAVDTATVVVAEPAAATLAALWAEPLVTAAWTTAALVLVILLFVRLARGRIFERGSSRLAAAAAFTIMLGWFASFMLTNMTVNGALSAISDYTYDGVIFEFNYVPLAIGLVIGAMGMALQVGERLKRDTEGLV